MKHKFILIILIFALLTPSLSAKEVPSSGEMLMEPLARVIGLASLAIGTALFIPSAILFGIPNWIYTGSPEAIKNTGKRLVVNPALYTFTRAPGDYPGYMEELEIVKE